MCATELALIQDADPKHQVITHTNKMRRAFPMSKKHKLNKRKRSEKHKGDLRAKLQQGLLKIPA